MKLTEKIINNIELAEKYLSGEYESAPINNIPFNRFTGEDEYSLKYYRANNGIVAIFDEIKFNPTDSCMYIYEDVIDAIVDKYWNVNNRKITMETKVKEFYDEFKEFKNVKEAYNMFLDSDRLFED